MAETTIKIEGMNCQHCVMRVKKTLDALPGVASAHVEVGSAKVGYDDSRIKIGEIEAAIEKAGYKVGK